VTAASRLCGWRSTSGSFEILNAPHTGETRRDARVTTGTIVSAVHGRTKRQKSPNLAHCGPANSGEFCIARGMWVIPCSKNALGEQPQPRPISGPAKSWAKKMHHFSKNKDLWRPHVWLFRSCFQAQHRRERVPPRYHPHQRPRGRSKNQVMRKSPPLSRWLAMRICPLAGMSRSVALPDPLLLIYTFVEDGIPLVDGYGVKR
jgi:hypothetical protein